MTYTLQTTVENVITRILLMEAAALDIEQGASKHWWYLPQAYPYWTNRPAGLRATATQNEWMLDIQARLWLEHTSQVNTGTTPVQTGVWSYIPAVLAYFREHKQLDMTGQANLTYIGTTGLIINNNNGLEVGTLPITAQTIFFYTDFTIQVPILIYEVIG